MVKSLQFVEVYFQFLSHLREEVQWRRTEKINWHYFILWVSILSEILIAYTNLSSLTNVRMHASYLGDHCGNLVTIVVGATTKIATIFWVLCNCPAANWPHVVGCLTLVFKRHSDWMRWKEEVSWIYKFIENKKRRYSLNVGSGDLVWTVCSGAALDPEDRSELCNANYYNNCQLSKQSLPYEIFLLALHWAKRDQCKYSLRIITGIQL